MASSRRSKPVPLRSRRYTLVDEDGEQERGASLAAMFPGFHADELPSGVARLRKGASTVVGGGAEPAVRITRTK